MSGQHCPTCSCTVSAGTVPEPKKPCAGFQWIGQSLAHCDRCGLPYWEHSHEERLREGTRVFSPGAVRLVPITPEDAAACKRKWGTP